MSRRAPVRPAPWKAVGYMIVDATGSHFDPGFHVERIAKAVNAFESPTVRAERAVVKAAVALETRLRTSDGTELHGQFKRVCKSVDRLLAARKAARGKR